MGATGCSSYMWFRSYLELGAVVRGGSKTFGDDLIVAVVLSFVYEHRSPVGDCMLLIRDATRRASVLLVPPSRQ